MLRLATACAWALATALPIGSAHALPTIRHVVAAEETTFEAFHAAARVRYLEKMTALATWAADVELFAERDRVFRAMLVIDPDNAFARKGLRYSRKSDGTWQEPSPREARNMNPKALPELPARRKAAVVAYHDEIEPALERFGADARARALVLADYLLADPDDATARTAQGEVFANDAWVLRETATGRTRRVALKETVETARAAVGDVWKVEPTSVEADLGVDFKTRIGTKHVRVLGTPAAEECTSIARACAVVPAVLKFALGVDAPLEADFTVYVLGSIKENGVLVDKLPGLDAGFRETLKKCVGAKLPGQPRVVTWDETTPRRLDNASRSTLNGQLGSALGLGLTVGWAWEGLGLYLNREITGTRLTWFTQPGSASKPDALRKKLMTTDVNWMQEALTILQRETHPSLKTVLERDVNTLTTEEMLVAYVFAAYLVEGRPEEVTKILDRVGRGAEPSVKVVPEVLGLDLPALESRLVRWLSERR